MGLTTTELCAESDRPRFFFHLSTVVAEVRAGLEMSNMHGKQSSLLSGQETARIYAPLDILVVQTVIRAETIHLIVGNPPRSAWRAKK
jgi:hypothetical protein